MDLNVGSVGIANALASQEKVAELVGTAQVISSILNPVEDDYDCPCGKGTFQDYAETYAEGEAAIDKLYLLAVATAPIGGKIPSKKQIRDEYAITHPEYALARLLCESIERKGDKAIAMKMRLYDLTHPYASARKRQAYYQQIVALYAATHPEYDIIKTAKADVARKSIDVIY